jgi:cytochrome c oxidase subunit 2
MKYGKHLAIVAVLILLGSALTYFLLTAIYQLPAPASVQAEPIDQLFKAHFFLISFLFSLVVVFMLYSLVVFRRRPGDEGDGDYFHGHTGLEVLWTIVPLSIVIFFGVWGAQVLQELTTSIENEMVVKVFGQQWSWSFEYPAYGNLRTGELVLPVDQPVLLQMESADVLHSFWVPEFRVKQDLLPGQVTELHITPTKTGEYKLRCAEMCGLQHSTMLADVRVLSTSEFDAWVQEQSVDVAAMSPAERGEMWYEQFCQSCHSLDGSIIVGPSWQGLFGSERQLEGGETMVADEDYIRNSILHPVDQIVAGFPAAMPTTFEQQFAEEEAKYDGEVDIVEDLIAFIKTLGDEGDQE